MSRSKHQFRPGILDQFETRVVPTVAAFPGIGPFLPPGQDAPYTNGTGISYTNQGNPFAGFFDVSGDKISTTVTNTSGKIQYVNLTVYTAPGGPDSLAAQNTTGQTDNLASQKLAYTSEVIALNPGDSHTFCVDLSTLKLTGQEKCQADVMRSDTPDGFAPDKLRLAELGDHFVYGELFDYTKPNGKR